MSKAAFGGVAVRRMVAHVRDVVVQQSIVVQLVAQVFDILLQLQLLLKQFH